jgi:hypothetical protein
MQVVCNKCGWTEKGLTKSQAYDLARYVGCQSVGCEGGNLAVLEDVPVAKAKQSTWQAYCMSCGQIAESSCGDDVEQATKAHKKSNPEHCIMIASEILADEVV